MRLFSERWDGQTGRTAGRNGENWDKIIIKRTKDGWHIDNDLAYRGTTDKSGNSILFELLN